MAGGVSAGVPLGGHQASFSFVFGFGSCLGVHGFCECVSDLRCPFVDCSGVGVAGGFLDDLFDFAAVHAWSVSRMRLRSRSASE